jgi:cell division protein FtsQ
MLSAIHAPLRRSALVAGLVAIGGSVPWWGTHALGTLAFFRVRAVEVQGAHYVSPQAVVERLRVDTLMSVWNDLRPLAGRVRAMAGIRDVAIGRSLPSTIVVHVTERTPVAFAPTAAGLRVFDGTGAPLPIDPTREDLDLPVVQHSDVGTLELLASLQEHVPVFYAQISEVRRSPTGDLVFQLPGLRVLALSDADPQRFATVPLVTADLVRRKVHAQEIDLRFRDQVVARWQ